MLSLLRPSVSVWRRLTIVANMVNMTSAADELVSRVRLRQQLPQPRVCRAIREAHGVTQTELATAIGVSRQTLIHWEQGQRAPRRESAERYAQVLLALQGKAS